MWWSKKRRNLNKGDDAHVPVSETEKHTPAYWQDITPGSTVTLSDEQALEDAMAQGAGIRGLDYIVKTVDTVTHLDGIAEWRFLHLEGDEQDLSLMIKIVDNEIMPIIFFEPPEFEPGSRAFLLNRGHDWLFEAPATDDCVPAELQFTAEIMQTVEQDGGVVELHYQAKAQGVMYGNCRRQPAGQGLPAAGAFTALMEYRAAEQCENPELLILETGGQDDPDGGHLTLYLGCPARLNEIDVLKAG